MSVRNFSHDLIEKLKQAGLYKEVNKQLKKREGYYQRLARKDKEQEEYIAYLNSAEQRRKRAEREREMEEKKRQKNKERYQKQKQKKLEKAKFDAEVMFFTFLKPGDKAKHFAKDQYNRKYVKKTSFLCRSKGTYQNSRR